MDEKFFDPNYVPGAFIEHGRKGMKLWRNVMDGCKYLVVRRDGTVPEFPVFVLGARDPWASEALRAYAREAASNGAEQDFVESVMQEADKWDAYRVDHGEGDPEAAPHRVDDPSIIQVMRDCAGGKVFLAMAWDAQQYQRELEKEKSGE